MRPRLSFSGRTFLAFVVEPTPPVDEWLDDLDRLINQSSGFFASRPVVVDLSKLNPDRFGARTVVDQIRDRGLRLIAVEGTDPSWLEPDLAPIVRGKDTGRQIAVSDEGAVRPAGSRLIDGPVRSGQAIFHADGDLTVVGSVASGAEVAAAGSIHIYGFLKGRAFAGAMGDRTAGIFCRKFDAELIAIDGCYQTAEQSPADMIDKPVRIRLDGDTIEMTFAD